MLIDKPPCLKSVPHACQVLFDQMVQHHDNIGEMSHEETCCCEEVKIAHHLGRGLKGSKSNPTVLWQYGNSKRCWIQTPIIASDLYKDGSVLFTKIHFRAEHLQ